MNLQGANDGCRWLYISHNLYYVKSTFCNGVSACPGRFPSDWLRVQDRRRLRIGGLYKGIHDMNGFNPAFPYQNRCRTCLRFVVLSQNTQGLQSIQTLDRASLWLVDRRLREFLSGTQATRTSEAVSADHPVCKLRQNAAQLSQASERIVGPANNELIRRACGFMAEVRVRCMARSQRSSAGAERVHTVRISTPCTSCGSLQILFGSAMSCSGRQCGPGRPPFTSFPKGVVSSKPGNTSWQACTRRLCLRLIRSAHPAIVQAPTA